MSQAAPVITDMPITVAANISWRNAAIASACASPDLRISVGQDLAEIDRRLAHIAAITGVAFVLARPGP